jgi:hypothetical protein
MLVSTGRGGRQPPRVLGYPMDLPSPPRLDLRDPEELELEVVDLPRDAFFGECETVSIEEAVGRIAGEMATPYPPGIPAFLPGERLNQTVIDYLRSGLEMGMNLPDVTNASWIRSASANCRALTNSIMRARTSVPGDGRGHPGRCPSTPRVRQAAGAPQGRLASR